jgi:thioredoxin 1
VNKIPTEGSAVVQFGAKWCSPCKHIRPLVEKLAQGVQAKFVYMDMEEDFTEANKHSIQAMPTIIAFKDGQELGRVPGANKKAIESLVLAL